MVEQLGQESSTTRLAPNVLTACRIRVKEGRTRSKSPSTSSSLAGGLASTKASLNRRLRQRPMLLQPDAAPYVGRNLGRRRPRRSRTPRFARRIGDARQLRASRKPSSRFRAIPPTSDDAEARGSPPITRSSKASTPISRDRVRGRGRPRNHHARSFFKPKKSRTGSTPPRSLIRRRSGRLASSDRVGVARMPAAWRPRRCRCPRFRSRPARPSSIRRRPPSARPGCWTSARP